MTIQFLHAGLDLEHALQQHVGRLQTTTAGMIIDIGRSIHQWDDDEGRSGSQSHNVRPHSRHVKDAHAN